jgi:hypothetical protein
MFSKSPTCFGTSQVLSSRSPLSSHHRTHTKIQLKYVYISDDYWEDSWMSRVMCRYMLKICWHLWTYVVYVKLVIQINSHTIHGTCNTKRRTHILFMEWNFTKRKLFKIMAILLLRPLLPEIKNIKFFTKTLVYLLVNQFYTTNIMNTLTL